MISRLKALRHIYYGLQYRYPLCCVLTFAFNDLFRPRSFQAVKRGNIPVKRRNGETTCVACRFHQLSPHWKPYGAPKFDYIIGKKESDGMRIVYVGHNHPSAHKYKRVRR